MRILLFIIAISILPIVSFAQLPPVETIDLEDKDFLTVDAQYSKYYKKLQKKVKRGELEREGSEYKEWLKWRKMWRQRLPQGGSFEDYFKLQRIAAKYNIKDANRSQSGSTEWIEIGPLDSQKTTNKGQIGPLEFVTFAPNNPSHMLTGSTNGGLFYSADGGEYWVPAGSDTQWDVSGCTAAAFKKNDSTTWFATASTTTASGVRPGIIGINTGVYRTTNAGQTWEPIANASLGQIPSEWSSMHKVLVLEGLNPASDDDDVLLVCTSKGIMRADNNIYIGSNNTNPIIYSSPDNNTITNDIVGKLVYDIEEIPDGSTGQYLFAAVRSGGTAKWTIQESSDWGATWNRISNESTSSTPVSTEYPPNMKNADFVTLEMSKANPSKLFCIIDMESIEGTSLNNSEIWVYDISDGEWNTTPLIDNINLHSVSGEGHGFGISPFDTDKFAFSNDISYRITDDGGINTASKSINHSDIEDIIYHPTNPNEVWFAHHGGLSKLTLINGVHGTIESKSEQIGVATIWGMSTSDKEANRIAVGLYHNGTWATEANVAYANSDWEPKWSRENLGDGMKPLVDSDHLWTARQNSAGYIRKPYPGADTSFPLLVNSKGVVSTGLSHLIEQNKANPSHIYQNSKINMNMHELRRDTLWYNSIPAIVSLFTESISDFAATHFSAWIGGDNNNPDDSSIITGIHSTPLDEDYIYLTFYGYDADTGIFHPSILRTTQARGIASDVINSWKDIPITKDVFDIEISHKNPDIIFTVQASDNPTTGDSQGVKMVTKVDVTDINNIQCMDITHNLPKVSLGSDCLALEKGTNEGLYLATSKGVFYTNKTRLDNPNISNDNKWILIGSGLPHVTSRGIEINYSANKIRVGTHGRGVWEHELECPTDFDLTLANTGVSDEFWEVENKLESSRSYSPSHTINYRGGKKVILRPGFTYVSTNPDKKFHAFIHGCSEPGNSFKSHSPLENERIFNKGVEKSIEEKPISEKPLMPNIYPNPNSGIFKIALPNREENATIEVYDLSGKKVRMLENTNDNVTIDISDQLNGIYIVKITLGADVFTQKIIKN